MNYKKIFKTRKSRTLVLRALRFLPDSLMLRIQYWIKLNRLPDLKNPKRFTEKLQWYKINYRNPEMNRCVDKSTVRSYVEEHGLGHILTKCYGVYDNLADIDFDKLPDAFVIKRTNGGGGLDVMICRSKATFDLEAARKTIQGWLDRPATRKGGGREWAYVGLKPRVIIEEYLENPENPEAGISDYKFFCSKGEVLGLVVDVDRYIDHKRNFYTPEWKYLDVSSDCANFGDTLPKPAGFEKMVEIAGQLSKEFPFVRVDLYLINERVYFGELTFYPWSGYVQFTPDSYDFDIGSKIAIP